MVVVAAAGNDGTQRLIPPASAPSAITVGGLDDRNSFERHLWRIYHSNYGQCANSQPKPEVIAPAMWLAAPMLPRTRVHNQARRLFRLDRIVERMHQQLGQDRAGILSSGNSRSPQLERTRRQIRQRMIKEKYIHPHYQHVDGTSMAAAVASSVVAQMLEANPALSPARVKEILVTSAIPMPGVPKERQGAGVIDAARAVALARRAAGGPLQSLPVSPHVWEDCITFYYYDPTGRAGRVALTGSFNGWNPEGFDLQPSSRAVADFHTGPAGRQLPL
jgi:serine protease AprX